MTGKIEFRAFGTGNDGKTPTPGDWEVAPSLHGDNLACVRADPDERYTTGDMIAADARIASASPKLLEVALAYEQWEADLLNHDSPYDADGSVRIPDELWDRLLEIQAMRNAAVAKAAGETP